MRKVMLAVAIVFIVATGISCVAVEGSWASLSGEEVWIMASSNETYPDNMKAVLKDGDLVWINGAGYGHKASAGYDYVPIPPQDVSGMFEWVEGGEYWEFIGVYGDLMWYDPVALLPRSQHIGRLIAVDTGLVKPATVRRWYEGATYDVHCLVSQSIVDMWLADDLNLNDWVIVSFIDEIPDTEEISIAIVVDKVYESWLP